MVLLTLLISAAMTAATGVAAAPPEPTVRIEPAQLQVAPGEEFELQLMIDGVEDLAGFEFNMGYDPAVIEVTDAGLGDFLEGTERLVIPVDPQISEEEGSVAFGALSVGQEAGVNGSGLLARITCRSLAEGRSDLILQKAEVFNSTPELLSIQREGGEVTVSGSSGEAAQSSVPSSGTTPWGWIGGTAAVVAVAAAAAFTLLRKRRRNGREVS